MIRKMLSVYFSYILDHLPAFFTMALMSVILLKFVWTEKKKKQNFREKSVFITNCDSGLGTEIAKRLDKLGFTVFAGFSVPNDEIAQRLKYKTSSSLRVVEIDVTNDESIVKAAQQIRIALETPGLHCLINNGCPQLSGKFEWYSTLQYQKAINVYLTGMICVTKHLLPLLKPVKGRIINMGGIGGEFISPYLSMNYAMKTSIKAFSDALQYEMEDFGITVSLVTQEDFLPMKINLISDEDISAMWENLNEEQKASCAQEFNEWNHREQSKAKKMHKFGKDIIQKEIHFVEHAVTSDEPKKYYSNIHTSLKIFRCLQSLVPQNYRKQVTKFFLKLKD